MGHSEEGDPQLNIRQLMCQHPEILYVFKVHSSSHNYINKDKGRWGPVITQRLPFYLHASRADSMVYILSTFVLFLGSSKAGRGDMAPQNAILSRGQLAQGQGTRHGVARPLCTWEWICWQMHQIKEQICSQGTYRDFKQRDCCCPVFLRAYFATVRSKKD